MTPKFNVHFLEDASMFLEQIEISAREKIIYNIRKAQIINDQELFKKLNNLIWEFRTLHKKTKYRLFAFWDKSQKTEALVIITHGLVKKTDKTPNTDIEKAERMMSLYLKQKQ